MTQTNMVWSSVKQKKQYRKILILKGCRSENDRQTDWRLPLDRTDRPFQFFHFLTLLGQIVQDMANFFQNI